MSKIEYLERSECFDKSKEAVYDLVFGYYRSKYVQPDILKIDNITNPSEKKYFEDNIKAKEILLKSIVENWSEEFLKKSETTEQNLIEKIENYDLLKNQTSHEEFKNKEYPKCYEILGAYTRARRKEIDKEAFYNIINKYKTLKTNDLLKNFNKAIKSIIF